MKKLADPHLKAVYARAHWKERHRSGLVARAVGILGRLAAGIWATLGSARRRWSGSGKAAKEGGRGKGGVAKASSRGEDEAKRPTTASGSTGGRETPPRGKKPPGAAPPAAPERDKSTLRGPACGEPAPPTAATGVRTLAEASAVIVEEEMLSEEGRRTLLRLRKKLREVLQIGDKVAAGEPVETNQRIKAEAWPQLLDELRRFGTLTTDVQEGIDDFVEVAPGARPGGLRTDASRPAQAGRGATWAFRLRRAMVPVRGAPAPAPPPTPGAEKHKRPKRRGGQAKKVNSSDDDQGWVEVGRTKKKLAIPEEEKVARHAALAQRQAQRVQSESSVPHTRTKESLNSFRLLDEAEISVGEDLISKVVADARAGLLKKKSVDLTPMRNKYFFGFAYTYGAQKEHPGAHGVEAVWPPDEVEPIPSWIRELLIVPLEKRGVVPKGWINSATINDYAAGGCIVSHIDPQHLFDRPIIGVNFFSECNLVFGTTFKFPKDAADIECSTPVYVHPCQRGFATIMKGYSANDITHAIRPCDLPSRRASIILRRVLPTAPVLLRGTCVPLRDLPKALSDASLDSGPLQGRSSASSKTAAAPPAASTRGLPTRRLRNSERRYKSGVIYNIMSESFLTQADLQNMFQKICKDSSLRWFAGRHILDFKVVGLPQVDLPRSYSFLAPLVEVLASMASQSMHTGEELAIIQLIVNYYGDGGSEVASHRHKCRQICASLGDRREVTVEEETLVMGNGDALPLSGEVHAVPPARCKSGPRASVCLFYGSRREYAAQGISVNARKGKFGDDAWWTHPADG